MAEHPLSNLDVEYLKLYMLPLGLVGERTELPDSWMNTILLNNFLEKCDTFLQAVWSCRNALRGHVTFCERFVLAVVVRPECYAYLHEMHPLVVE
jgi:hypothetical protein